MTECPNGREHLTPQQMIDLESLLSKMVLVIESVPDFVLELISDSLYLNSEKFVPNRPTLLKRSSLVLLIQSVQTKLLRLNQQLKEGKDIFTISVKERRCSPCKDQLCLQCKCDSSFSRGMMSQDTENQAPRSL